MKTLIFHALCKPFSFYTFHSHSGACNQRREMTLLAFTWTTRALGDKFSRGYSYQVHSGIVISYFARGVSRNSRKMVAETRCIFRWLPRNRHRRLPCVNTLTGLFLRLCLSCSISLAHFQNVVILLVFKN